MKNILLIDFGASRIKSTCSNNYEINFETKGSISYEDKKFHPIFFYKSLKKHLAYYKKNFNLVFNKIYVCTEMHGFFLSDGGKKNITSYYTWRYSAKKKIKINDQKYLDLYLFKKTGLKLKPGLPILNFLSEQKKTKLNYLCGVAESLCIFGGKYNGNLHNTYSQSTGFYDLKNNFFFKNFFKNKICSNLKTNLGYTLFENKKIYVFGGYGDLQCATLGSNIKNNNLLMNLGTGSQIISKIKSKIKNNNIEKRIFFNNSILYCVTHIPSGRMLNYFSNLIDKICNKKNYFWVLVKKIKVHEIIKSNHRLNLDLLNYKSINNSLAIKKYSKKNIKFFCIELLKCYFYQYIFLIKKNFNIINYSKIIISGGITIRIPCIKDYIEQKLKLPVKIRNTQLDESILGLIKLSK